MCRLPKTALACVLLLGLAPPVTFAHADLGDIPRSELIQVATEPGASLAAAEILAALDRAESMPDLDLPELGIRVYRTPGRDAVIPPAVARVDGVRWASKVASWDLPAGELVGRTEWEPSTLHAGGDPGREPFWSLQWNMGSIGNLHDGWLVATGLGSLIGIIDTGVDCAHVDIPCSAEVNHYDALRRVEMAGMTDRLGHGTHVAGIAAGKVNGRGVAGVAYDAEVVACKACSDGGRCSEIDVMACIVYLAPRGIRVANMSLGGTYGASTPGLCEAISWAEGAHDMLSVASVGNAGGRQPLYPATCGGVMGVAASIGPYGNNLADYSQRASVDITAPGGDGTQGGGVLSAVPGNRWAWLSGTSMAAPHVTGAAALLAESLGSSWTPDRARNLLQQRARKICGAEYQSWSCGWGALDANSALRGNLPAPPPDDEPTATPWWPEDTPTPEPTPTVEPSPTNIPAVQTALAELTASAQPPTETPTATSSPEPTDTQAPASATATLRPPTASSTPTLSPTPSDTPDAVALTVTALWPTRTPDISGTLTAIAPTPDRVATAVYATLNAPGAIETRAVDATARAKGRHGPQYFPALLRVLPEPIAGPTDPCNDVLYPWACKQRTREIAETATAAAAATMTAAAPTPAPTRSWPLMRREAR